ncbi:MAG: N-acetylmuramoyl-L-alanine amidase [Anaerolineae bacterium]|nr:N-acetylmuramoyl-L-alanine amidase [Anaerolineae bacterium]
MSDDSRSKRQPFGERDDEEKKRPFGSRSRPKRASSRWGPYPDETPGEQSSDRLPHSPYQPGQSSGFSASSSTIDSLLGSDDDPSHLSWNTLLSDVDTSAAPSGAKHREANVEGWESPTRSERGGASSTQSGRPGRDLHLPDRSFLKRRRESQEIAAASYVADLPEEEEEEQTQVVIRFGIVFRSMGTILLAAAVVATLFTWWTPSAFLPPKMADQLAIAQATQASQQSVTHTAPERTIGIVSGHRGIYPPTGQLDPGAVCPDGLTEQQVNENVAKRVEVLLEREGYQVDLLDEFDARLRGYQALALVSIHADSCDYINDLATGFKVASFAYSTAPDADERLMACMTERYAAATGLSLHPSVTDDMTNYHNFQEIAPSTPGVVIEIGFLYLDRILLTERADAVAYGIFDGILCFLRNELPDGEATDLPLVEVTATPVP